MPLRVVPSSTLSSNRCLGIAFLSRADREIAVFRHVAPPSRLCLEFPRETASSEVRGEGREPLADKAGKSTLLSRSGGVPLLLMAKSILFLPLVNSLASQVALLVKNSPADAGDVRDAGSIPGSGRSSGGGHANPLQTFCLENPQGQRSLVGYSPWGLKESDTIE